MEWPVGETRLFVSGIITITREEPCFEASFTGTDCGDYGDTAPEAVRALCENHTSTLIEIMVREARRE